MDAARKRRNSDTVQVHNSRLLTHYPPRKGSDSALLQKPLIPPRTSSMPLKTSAKKPVTDENSWTAFLKIHRKDSHTINNQTTMVEENPEIKVIEDDTTVLILEWIENKYEITAGRPSALFEKLMDQEQDYVDAYLMNHTSFISSTSLLSQLVETFYSTSLLQSRALYIIHRWLLLCFYDFKDKRLLNQLNLFLSQECIFNEKIYQIQSILQLQRPSLSIPHTCQSYRDRSIFSIDSKHLAHYLSLVDRSLFEYISNYELIHYGDKEQQGIDLMTQRFNKLNRWIIHELHLIKNFKMKKVLIKKFIEIAKICLDLNNFHTCMIIAMSLNQLHLATFRPLQKLLNVNNNMRYYRHTLLSVQTLPVIPFLPIVLKDITFLKENTRWTTPELVNFNTCRSIHQSLKRCRHWVSKSYPFAQDLMSVPYFSSVKGSGALDPVGGWLEDRLQ